MDSYGNALPNGADGDLLTNKILAQAPCISHGNRAGSVAVAAATHRTALLKISRLKPIKENKNRKYARNRGCV